MRVGRFGSSGLQRVWGVQCANSCSLKSRTGTSRVMESHEREQSRWDCSTSASVVSIHTGTVSWSWGQEGGILPQCLGEQASIDFGMPWKKRAEWEATENHLSRLRGQCGEQLENGRKLKYESCGSARQAARYTSVWQRTQFRISKNIQRCKAGARAPGSPT